MAAQTQSTREILKKVRRIELKTRRTVTDALAGAYHSVFRGQGMNFEEVREYQPGDEVRSIDWNVTARMDQPFIKVYREERELTLLLMVDVSGSGAFGSADQSKRELAAELACVLAFAAIRNADKVGVLLFTDKVEKFIPPAKGREHALRLIRDILFFEPQGSGTDFEEALRYVRHVLQRKAVVFLVSDFLDPALVRAALQTPPKEATPLRDPWMTRAPPPARKAAAVNVDTPLFRSLRLTNKRHDLVCATLSDPREQELPDVGRVLLEDAETGELVEVNTSSARVRARFAEAGQRRRELLTRGLRQCGIDVLELSTDRPYERALRAFFEQRERRQMTA